MHDFFDEFGSDWILEKQTWHEYLEDSWSNIHCVCVIMYKKQFQLGII